MARINLYPIYEVVNASGSVRIVTDYHKALRLARIHSGRVIKSMVSLERYAAAVEADAERAARAYRKTKKRPLF